VGGVPGKYLAQVSLTEDQHPVGDFGADPQHEAFAGSRAAEGSDRRGWDRRSPGLRRPLEFDLPQLPTKLCIVLSGEHRCAGERRTPTQATK
jgi:hypothetical protein